MAVTSTPKKVSVSVKLNDGVDSDGNISVVSLSLGSLSLNGYDDEKALAVVSALNVCNQYSD